MVGVVLTMKPMQKYGFIKGEDGKEYFFHKDDLRNVNWNQMEFDFSRGFEKIHVEFEPTEAEKGKRAKDVMRLNGEGE